MTQTLLDEAATWQETIHGSVDSRTVLAVMKGRSKDELAVFCKSRF